MPQGGEGMEAYTRKKLAQALLYKLREQQQHGKVCL